MSTMNRFALLMSLTLMLGACAHHRDVRPGANGVHRISLTVEDADDGNRDAISQANNFCEERKKTAGVVREQTKYIGTMDEKSYRNGKNLSKAAQIIGGSGATYGTATKSNNTGVLGGLIGVGGGASDAALGKGYQVNMSFRCI